MTAQVNAKPRGRQFFNNPGPTNIPDRILRAMDRPVMDFLAPEFLEIHHACHAGVKRVLKTDQNLFLHASTGHGAWEAAVANLFSPGDHVLVIETGYFSLGWKEMGEALGLKVETLNADWRTGIDIARITERLTKDKAHEIKGVLAVHNETATGLVLPLQEVRRAHDEAKHPALLLSDTISSLGSMEYKMDAWGIDVTVGGSQKGLMMPTGLALTGVSKKAMEASRKSKLPKYYFNWELMAARMPQKFIGTVPVHMFFGLQESIKILEEETLDAVFARHARLAEATREAVRAWGADGKGPDALRPDEGSPVQLGDHRADAGGPHLRRHAQGGARALQPLARRRPRPTIGQGVPHRPSRRSERADAAGLPRHHRAGDEDSRRAVRARRRRRRDQVAGELAPRYASPPRLPWMVTWR